MIIYKTTNLINGKIYIGQDTHNNPNYYGSGNSIKRAIKKYGKKNFRKDIIEYCFSLEQLNEREMYWIKAFNSREKNIGYNIAIGGNNIITQLNYKMSSEHKKNLSKAHKGKKLTDEHKEKIRLKHLGRKFTEEHKRKISKANKGQIPWTKGKVGPMKGKHHSDETREKMKLSHIGKPSGALGKIPWNKGKSNIYSLETLLKMKEAKKNYIPWNAPQKLNQVCQNDSDNFYPIESEVA